MASIFYLFENIVKRSYEPAPDRRRNAFQSGEQKGWVNDQEYRRAALKNRSV
jgi:hypothetical protein